MLVRMNGPGRARQLSLCDSAAKWTTASCSATSGSTSRGVGDVADDELDPVGGELVERLPAGGVGQLVEHRHRGVGVAHHVVHEVGADEAGAAGHENVESTGGQSR